MNEIYAGVGSSNRGLVGRALAPEQPAPGQPPQSAAIFNGMMERLGGLMAMAERVETLADRLTGQAPADPRGADGVNATMPQAFNARLDLCIEGMDAVRARLQAALQRLERFA